MATRVVAPPSPDYVDRSGDIQRAARAKTLRAKQQWTPADQAEVLRLLLEDYVARTQTGP